MNILVTGSTGFIGSALVSFLSEEGHRVARLVRRPLTAPERQVRWNPEAGTVETEGLAGIDAVVHLAAENLADRRWTAARKRRIRDSRVKGTRLLCEAVAGLDPPPKVLACASAPAYYGDRGDEVLTEESGPGRGFLAETVRQWEAATEPAARAGIRVVNPRFGVVLDPTGGLLGRLLLPFRLGLGTRLGSGRQYWSWSTLEDVTRATLHALTTDSLRGPVNAAAGAATNAEFTKALGRVLSRPAILWAPRWVLRLALGEVADSVLASARMDSSKLLASGFEFRHTELEGAMRAVLGRA